MVALLKLGGLTVCVASALGTKVFIPTSLFPSPFFWQEIFGPPAETMALSTHPDLMKKGRLKYACPPEGVFVQDQPVKAPHPFSLWCKPLPPSVDHPWML